MLASRKVARMAEGHEHLTLTKLGTAHGGWLVPEEYLKPGATAICVGAGEDISFDVELNKRGMNVVTMDPTPRAKKHVEQVMEAAKQRVVTHVGSSGGEAYDLKGFDLSRFQFLDLGVWSEEKTMRFYSPKDKSHVSHSVVNLQKTEEYFEAHCVTLKSVCERIGTKEIDLLKMDIEGAEHEVLKSMAAEGPFAQVLCVEFDEIRNPLDDGYYERIAQSVEVLKKVGYHFVLLDESNALFLRDSRGDI